MVAVHGPRDRPNEGEALDPTYGWIQQLSARFDESSEADGPGLEKSWPVGAGLFARPHKGRVLGQCALPLGFRCELVFASDSQKFTQAIASAVDPALHGTDGAAADLGGFLVGHAGCTHQDECFPLVRRELAERFAKVEEIHVSVLGGGGSEFPAICPSGSATSLRRLRYSE